MDCTGTLVTREGSAASPMELRFISSSMVRDEVLGMGYVEVTAGRDGADAIVRPDDKGGWDTEDGAEAGAVLRM